MNMRKLLLLISILMVASQLSWAQTPVAVVPAGKAVTFSKPRPVFPASAVPAGEYRSHVWVTKPMVGFKQNGVIRPAASVPCNQNLGSGGTPPFGFCPNGLQSAYQTASIVGANGGSGMTIGITDAYNDPDIASDLNTFDSLFGLPLCTTGNGCLKIVNEHGAASPLPGNAPNRGNSWAIEISLDVEYAHAMAPNAQILLVEANSPSGDDLFTAVDTAAGLADVVTNSWGGGEFNGETDYDTCSIFPGECFDLSKPIFFSSGDSGAPGEYPCYSPDVTCVGGTHLNVNASLQRTTETGWSGSGGGVSLFETTPSYQSANGVNFGARATPDIAADADPNTGVWITDTYDIPADSAVCCVGGTSLATPLSAAIYADVDTARVSFGKAKFGGPAGGIFLDNDLYKVYNSNYIYFFYDVTVGNNGFAAGVGFDLVTGIGVSKGPAMGNRFFGLP